MIHDTELVIANDQAIDRAVLDQDVGCVGMGKAAVLDDAARAAGGLDRVHVLSALCESRQVVDVDIVHMEPDQRGARPLMNAVLGVRAAVDRAYFPVTDRGVLTEGIDTLGLEVGDRVVATVDGNAHMARLIGSEIV